MIYLVVKLTTVGADAGPFDIYTNADSFGTPIAQNISKSQLLSGYLCAIDETKTTIIRVVSTGICENHFDIPYVYSLYTYTNEIDDEGGCGENCINSRGSISVNGEVVFDWDGNNFGDSGTLSLQLYDEVAINATAWNTENDGCESVDEVVNVYINNVLVASLYEDDTYTFTVESLEIAIRIHTTCVLV